MKNTNLKYFISIIAMVVVMFTTSVAGAFVISLESRNKAEISANIRKSEQEISKLKRETEDLNVRIAQQENPTILGKRASTRLVQPQVSGVIWVYEDTKADKVIFSEKNNGIVSLKISSRIKNID